LAASDRVLISEEKSEESPLNSSNISINFFYSERCGACHKVLPIVKEISTKYPNIPVYYYDTYNSPKNRSFMYTFAENYGVDYPAYPNLFAGDTIYLEGFTEIKNNIEDLFIAYDEGLIPDPEYEARWREQGGNISPDNSGRNSITGPSGSGAGEITLPLVIIGGLLDGINPCAISVLLILLASLSAAGSRKTIISAGISYTTAVFIFYTLAGAGILAITGFAGISVYFSVFAFVIALIAGILSIYEGVTGRQQNLIRIPESAKGILKKYLRMPGDEEEYKNNRVSGSDENKTLKADPPADESTNSNLLASDERLSAELRIDEPVSGEILPSSDVNAADEQISENGNTDSIIPARNNTPEIIRNTIGTQNSPVRKTGYIITTAFILGTFASMFELPCTGGIYIAVLSMISSTFSESAGSQEVSGILGIISGEFLTGIIYLLIYNLMFIMPLIIIIALMASGLPAGKIEKIDAFRTEKRRAIRIVTGIVMIVLAIYLGFGIAGTI
jgi:cytochrome c biogenesis protein CcdA/thiol-disulfide isomerase/thioredoxin